MPRMRLLVAAPVMVLVLLIILACGTASTGGSSVVVVGTVTAPPAPTHFKVGQQVKVGSTWLITVNSVKANTGDGIFQPASGNVYVVVDITLHNESAQPQDVSSVASFTFKDATGQEYTESFTDIGKPPDGTVAVGDLLRGQLVYEVPTSQKTFTLAFQANILDTSSTIWDITL